MKAKEYIKKYNKKIQLSMTDNEKLGKILIELLEEFTKEISILMDNRNSTNNKVLIGVLSELDNKWKAISRGINGINPNGFRDYLKIVSPSTVKLMKWI